MTLNKENKKEHDGVVDLGGSEIDFTGPVSPPRGHSMPAALRRPLFRERNLRGKRAALECQAVELNALS
jgi:hypothetical protein